MLCRHRAPARRLPRRTSDRSGRAPSVQRPYRALPAAAAVIVAIAGCSSGPSAVTACKDFSTWVAAQHGGHGADLSELASAAAAAPPGQLYTDLNSLNVNASYNRTDPEVAQLTGTEVQIVRGDCAAVHAG
jgi:hypothetical protein